jgi:peptidoglycan DL-endopeptidase CwlO
MLLGVADRAQAEESLGNKIKKVFAPTPTPPPRKHRKSSSAPKKKEDADKSPAPKSSATPEKSPSPSPSKKKGASGSLFPAEEPEPSASSSPKRKKKSSPTPAPESSPSPSSKKKHKPSPSPTPTPEDSPTPSSSATTTPETSEAQSPSPSLKKKGAPATIEAKDLSDYENYPPNVRAITDTALELTRRNLNYTYGSADPANGGMDCSGFVFYVLTQNGVRDVPRDSSQQYVWLRKAGNFRAVNSRREDSFELDELAPGDLLFWTGTYNIERDPPITHAMIYLGRDKKTNQRIMVGASDGRTYKGESRYGVSVFDFKIPRPGKTDEGRMSPSFIGYGHIPGL